MNIQSCPRVFIHQSRLACVALSVVLSLLHYRQAHAQYEKPSAVFDKSSAQRIALAEKLRSEFVKLWDAPHQVRGVLATKDKQGTVRIEHIAQDSLQNSCLEYTYMYFSNKETWAGTEEYFVQQPNEDRAVGELFRQFGVLLQHKGFRIHPCNKSGRDALWKYSTPPSLTWYECEIIHNTHSKKNTDAIYGIALFNANGDLVQIKPLTKK
jgi:hypothetical protein